MSINIKVKPIGGIKPFAVDTLESTNTVSDLKKYILDKYADIKPNFTLIVAGTILKDDSMTLAEANFKNNTLVMLKPAPEPVEQAKTTSPPVQVPVPQLTSPIVPQIPEEDRPMSAEETECFAYLVDAGFDPVAAKDASLKAKGDMSNAVEQLSKSSAADAPLTNVFAQSASAPQDMADEGMGHFDLDEASKLMILQSLAQTNPELLNQLAADPNQMNAFFQMIAEEAVHESENIKAMEEQLTDEDNKMIDNLVQITGKERYLCIEAYLVNDKNADLAISYLLDSMND